jgi:heptosyltransferase-2
MGDALMNLPALHLLRQTFPKAWLTFLCDAGVADLFRGHPDIDEVMTVDAAALGRSFRARRELFVRIRKASFDVAVVSNPGKFFHALTWLARIPHRVGIDRKWGFLLTKRLPPAGAESPRHEIDRNLDLASLASDKTWDGTLLLPADETALRAVGTRLAAECPGEKVIVAVHPGTSNPRKLWAPARWAELCERAAEGGAAIVLIGGTEEAGRSAEVASKTRAPLVDWTGRLSLKELAAFLGHPRVKALVSSDSGPVHVAWMRGTPVVALYSKDDPGSDPRRWGPRDGGRSRAVWKPMAEITSSEVVALLAEIPGKK